MNRPTQPNRGDRPQTARPQTNRPQNGRPQGARPQPSRPQTAGPRGGAPVRPPYDRRLMEAERQRRREERYRAELRRRADNRSRLLRALLFLALYLVLCGLAAGIFAVRVANTNKPDRADYTYTYGSASEKVPYADTLTPDGLPAVNFTDVAVLCSLTTTGDANELRYITLDSDTENVRFQPGTRIVYVNGVAARMSGASRLVGNDLWVPLDFVTDYMTGVTAVRDAAAHTVTVTRTEAVNSTADEPVYEPVSYRIKRAPAIEAVSEESAIAAGNAAATTPGGTSASAGDLGFIKDLSAYEQYMNPPGDTYLTLINVAHPLASDYVPNDLIDVVNTRSDRSKRQMREYAEKALEAMFIELYANGYTDVSVTSGYRSYAEQQSLFTARVSQYAYLGEDEAYRTAATIVAIPGTSEHQSGLCVDMHNLVSADVSFENQAAFTWLKNNAHKFGFILRFPEDKTEQTGISYEPWHYRFVGRAHATKIYESGMCLEEYVASLGK